MKPNKKLMKQYKNKPIQMTPKQIEKMQNQATDHALEVILAFSLMALRDEYKFGKDRLLKFKKRFFELWDSYNGGYITIKDLWDTLEEETGVNFNGGEEDEI